MTRTLRVILAALNTHHHSRKAKPVNDQCEDCSRSRCPDCGKHICCDACPCGLAHNCPCECDDYDRRMTYAD